MLSIVCPTKYQDIGIWCVYPISVLKHVWAKTSHFLFLRYWSFFLHPYDDGLKKKNQFCNSFIDLIILWNVLVSLGWWINSLSCLQSVW